jgi:serine/threonine protein kinase
MFLGQGSYGKVIAKNGKAVKTFKKMNHLIQEYLAGRYLYDCPNVVSVNNFDLDNLEMEMKLYSGNLREWMSGNHNFDTKMDVCRQILTGLIYIHQRGLVHGDLKPGNIMMDEKNRVYIGDLGFVSLAPFSKVERTASVYRDINISHGPEHDMFSLGVIMIELFGDLKIRKQSSYKELHKLCRKKIKNNKVKDVILNLTSESHKERRTAEYLLNDLFDVRINIESKSFIISEIDTNSKAAILMKNIADIYDIKRAKRGYRLLENNSLLGAVAIMVILSSIFGKSGFDVKEATEKYDFKKKHLINEIERIISDDSFITALLLP